MKIKFIVLALACMMLQGGTEAFAKKSQSNKPEKEQIKGNLPTGTQLVEVNDKDMSYQATDTAKMNKLYERFAAADTSLRMEQIRDIYYSFAYTDHYSPMAGRSIQGDSAKKAGDTGLALEFYEKALKKSPVCLSLIEDCFNMIYAKEGEKGHNWRKYAVQYTQLIFMIESTGDGKSTESAIKVNWVSDEYSVMKHLGVKRLVNQSMVQGENNICDKMDVIMSDGQTQTLYFDITTNMARMNEIMNKF